MTEYKDTFKSTAPYYVRYRDAYPEDFFSVLRERFKLSKDDCILDLRCGPGPLAIPLSSYVGHVVAMDPEPEMLAAGKEQADKNGIENIEWTLGRSDDLGELPEDMRHFKLVTMGRSFHWMNREQTLRDLYAILTDDGGIAVVGNNQFWRHSKESRREVINAVVAKYLGDKRRAGSGFFVRQEKRHEDVIRESPFRTVEIWRGTWTKSSTIDDVIGYLFSTSAVSPHVLGDAKEDFENELREELLRINPSGTFTGEGETEAILAWK